MIELIILTLPGVAAAILHCKLNRRMNARSILLSSVFYIICTNILIFAGLLLIGMRHFSLFDMSLRFKIKWLILGLFIAVFICLTIKNLRGISFSAIKHKVGRLFPAALLLTVTYAVFTPSSLFLDNIDEFLLDYINILPIILPAALSILAAVIIFALCITGETSLKYYIGLIFSISLSAYIQGNFLNFRLPSLDGTEIDWSSYSLQNIISAVFWAACILITLGIVFRFKEKAEPAMKYISYFLSAVQLISLCALIFTNRLPENANHGFSKADEFTVGEKENVVIFIIDTLQASTLEEYITSASYPSGQLDDYTFFDNAVSGGAPTQLAVPLLMTGSEYDPTQSMTEYKKDLWKETPLYDYLHENNFDVRFFTTINSLPGIKEGIADNYAVTIDRHISSYTAFTKQLYKLTNFYIMPQFVKEYFWLTTDDLTASIESSNSCFRTNNYKFYQDLLDAGELQAKYEKAFRLYHLQGVHMPYNTDENMNPAEEGTVTEIQQLQGVMKEINIYIDEMKRLGVYDSSSIIILGDHGRHETDNPEANPALLIKLPNESHALEHNSAPVHFRNMSATIAGCVMEDYSAYGPSVYDITDDSDVERLHTINRGIRNRNYIDDEWDDDYDYCRLIIPQDTDSLDEYNVWDPYNINRITYNLGETIDFTTDNEYAGQLNYRLYKENKTAAASNELSICFDLTEHPKKDLNFHFTYSKVYNHKQDIRIYVNGSRTADIVCTDESLSGDNVITIPEKKITGNEVTIRMVFPNAVTPNQLDPANPDTRILSVEFDSMMLE